MAQDTPKIAVLMAAYNGKNYIQEQIESIAQQEGCDVKIIVSVDLSEDDTFEFVNSLRKQYPIIETLPYGKRYGGACANFFRLLVEARLEDFQYVALADQDDIWLPNKLINAVQKIKKKQVSAYSSNVTAFWPNGTKKLINKAQPQTKWDYMFESAGPGCTFVLSKKLALEVKSYLAQNTLIKNIALHDWFIYAFARSRNHQWFIDKKSFTLYRQHDGNVIGANTGLKAYISRWNKLRDGWLIDQAVLIAEALKYQESWPITKIKSNKWTNKFLLSLNAHTLRRRMRDSLILACSLILP